MINIGSKRVLFRPFFVDLDHCDLYGNHSVIYLYNIQGNNYSTVTKVMLHLYIGGLYELR